MRCARVVLLALVLGFAPARLALAGPLEELVQLAVHPIDPAVMALRYQFGGDGLVLTRDGGETWQALCIGALQADGLDQPPSRLGTTMFGADGSLYVAIFGGLLKSDPSGCTWTTEAPFDERWVSDLTRLSSDPTVLFAVTSSGGAGATNGVYRKSGAGAWEALGTQDALLISRLHVVELGGGDLRFYESAARGVHCDGSVCAVDETCCAADPALSGGTPTCGSAATPCEFGPASGSNPNYLVRVSDDLGETWTEHSFPETNGTMRLEAVDPSDPDRIVAVVTHAGSVPGGVGEEPDALYLSTDAGATFAEWASVRSFGGLAIAPDGRVWIGDRGDPADTMVARGISFAASLDATPSTLNGESSVSCVQYLVEGDRPLACRRFDAATADPTSGEYTKIFDFRETTAMLDCPSKDMCALCERQFLAAWCGITHFPEAPMCCCYSDQDRLMDPNYVAGSPVGAMLSCGAGADAGVGDGGTAGTTGATGGTGSDDAGTAGTGAGMKAAASDEGGCSCRAPGGPARAPAGLAILGLVLVCVVRARRGRGAR